MHKILKTKPSSFSLSSSSLSSNSCNQFERLKTKDLMKRSWGDTDGGRVCAGSSRRDIGVNCSTNQNRRLHKQCSGSEKVIVYVFFFVFVFRLDKYCLLITAIVCVYNWTNQKGLKIYSDLKLPAPSKKQRYNIMGKKIRCK